MTSASVLGLSLRYSLILTGSVALLAALLGFVAGGVPGLVSALIGALVAALFMALTALSLVVAQRVTKGDPASRAYFGIVISAWVIKIVIFSLVAWLVGSIAWLNAYFFFAAVVAAVVASLVADGLALQRARVPYVGDVALPGDEEPPKSASNGL